MSSSPGPVAPGGWSRVRPFLEPPYEVLIREPVRSGRLRLAGTDPLARHLAVAALVTLFLLMGSLLLSDLWRRGLLVDVSDLGGRWQFLPRALLPVTLVALSVGWLAFLWGAVRAAWPVRVAAGLLFVLVNAAIGRPTSAGFGETAADLIPPALGWAGYLTAAAVMLLAAVLEVRRSWYRKLRPVLFALLALSLALLFGSLLWIALDAIRLGLPNPTLLTLHDSLERTQNMLVPMVLLSAVAIVDFAYSLGQAATSPAWHLRATVVKVLVVGLIALKLWIQVIQGDDLAGWRELLSASPQILVAPALTLAGLAVVAFAWRRRLRRRATEAQVTEVKEQLMYAGLAGASLPLLVLLVLLGAASVAFSQWNSFAAFDFISGVARFTGRHAAVVRAVPWAVLLVVGIVFLARPRGTERIREAGLGLALLGGLNLPYYLLAALGRGAEFSFQLTDIMLTVGILAALVLRWRRIDLAEAVALAGLVLFGWALSSRGDFVEASLAFLHPPGALVLVAGLVWALLADSAVASEDSARFPREARVLLFAGYLVLSATILNWIEATHPVDSLSDEVFLTGFADIGIPIAAWLVIRRPLTRGEARLAALPGEEAVFEAVEATENEEREDEWPGRPGTEPGDGPPDPM